MPKSQSPPRRRRLRTCVVVFTDCERRNRCRGRSWEGKFPSLSGSIATPEKEKCKMLLARANLHSVFGAIAIPPPPPPPPPPITSSISDGGPPHPVLRQRKGSGASRPDSVFPIFAASLLEEAAQKYLHTRSAREESHAFTPRPPTRRISDFSR